MARTSRTPGVADSLVFVRAARQLVTLRGPQQARRGDQMLELAIIPDGALMIRNGRIEAVGSCRRIEKLKAVRDAVEIDATNTVILPAFIDTAARIFDHSLKRLGMEKAAGSILSGMVRHGIACAEVLQTPNQRLLRICAGLQGRPATLLPSLVLSSPADLELLESANRLKLLNSATVLVDAQRAAPALPRRLLAQAQALGVHTAIQAQPGCTEQAAFLAFDTRPAAFGGIESLHEISIQALARSDMVVTCRQARLLIDNGGALALGTHYDLDTNPDYNMPLKLAHACREFSLMHAEAITAATVNAAYAAGCAATQGSLEPGKWADLVLYECRDYNDILRHGTLDLVTRVVRRGKTVYRRGRVESL